MVDVSRTQLAVALGLRLPDSLAGEQELWQAVTNYSAWGADAPYAPKWVETIDNFLVHVVLESRVTACFRHDKDDTSHG